jgi:low affinity Fe/Cu permease
MHANGNPSQFQHFAVRSADLVGSHGAFLLAVCVILAWAISGPLFDYSDTWQLWINTGTTIVTFLMVFLIQYTQNRDAKSMHLKLDELLRTVHGARLDMIDLKDMSDDELQKLEQAFDRLARFGSRSRASRAGAQDSQPDAAEKPRGGPAGAARQTRATGEDQGHGTRQTRGRDRQ